MKFTFLLLIFSLKNPSCFSETVVSPTDPVSMRSTFCVCNERKRPTTASYNIQHNKLKCISSAVAINGILWKCQTNRMNEHKYLISFSADPRHVFDTPGLNGLFDGLFKGNDNVFWHNWNIKWRKCKLTIIVRRHI